MINIEIDGKQIETPHGSTVIEAAHGAGIAIPHFCYHKKLSLAANCRMCLVEIEKAPKPMPACVTPVTDGMKVKTHSSMAVKAQRGVMEFLLINHPLDCPICDQGGECTLQDLAMGYGGEHSRYQESKRTVKGKDLGPLVSAAEMSRCINCTRCVRFGQEVAGQMELGQAYRTEHAEIMSFLGGTVDSELSGNMIDLCPVGALTSKPFRYKARNWELSRRRTVSAHDSLGSNLAMNIKQGTVLRTLPIENEAINECWLSDRDRFAYEGLYADRLTQPMIRREGKLETVDWQTALEFAGNGLRHIANGAGAAEIGALATGNSTLEELHLLQKLVRGIGSEHVDFRLRQSDFSADGKQAGIPWLGMSVADIGQADRLLIVGSFLRKDHPVLAARIRQAVRNGAEVSLIHSTGDDPLMKVAHAQTVAPSELVGALHGVADAVTAGQDSGMAGSLRSGKKVAVLLGNFAQAHPQVAQLQTLAGKIAAATGGAFGFIGDSANAVGGYLAGAVPSAGGLNAAAMLAQPRKAYILLNVEPELDCANPQQAMAAMQAADLVISLSAYRHQAEAYADVILPIAAYAETSGTFVSSEGRVQSFNGAVKPQGEARPAWKVLRVLGNLLKLAGFDQDDSQTVRDEVLGGMDVAARLNNALEVAVSPATPVSGLQRIADVPIYCGDAIVRRAASLQATADAAIPQAWMCAAELDKLGLKAGDAVQVVQGEGRAQLKVACDNRLPAGTVRVAAGHAATAALGAMFGTITVERA